MHIDKQNIVFSATTISYYKDYDLKNIYSRDRPAGQLKVSCRIDLQVSCRSGPVADLQVSCMQVWTCRSGPSVTGSTKTSFATGFLTSPTTSLMHHNSQNQPHNHSHPETDPGFSGGGRWMTKSWNTGFGTNSFTWESHQTICPKTSPTTSLTKSPKTNLIVHNNQLILGYSNLPKRRTQFYAAIFTLKSTKQSNVTIYYKYPEGNCIGT